VNDVECVAFLQRVLPRMRMRWAGFRKVRGQVCKRLHRRLQELELESLAAYESHLAGHPDEWRTLERLCRITISRLYRDRAVFDALHDTLLQDLARRILVRGGRALRSWSAGCASGEEPYSLSLAWSLEAPARPPGVTLEIVATEIDDWLLERARVGCYSPGTLKELPSGWIAAAFDHVGDTFCLRPAFRDPVELVCQDIRREMPPGPFHVVLCRNLVFTYFEPSLQALLLERMLRRLAPDGLLILGSHETLPPGDWPLVPRFGALPIHRRSSPRG
jgi:chemotaxis protein methyltransferase CheR